MTLSDWIQFSLLIAALVGLIISLISNRAQQKAFTQQMRLQFFGEYTKRYQEIMVNLPSSISAKEFDYAKLDPAIREQTLRFMRAYFDLCSEEYDLYLKGYIDEATWKEWKTGIAHSFSKKAFCDAWAIIELNSYYYPDFVALVAKELKNKS